jgi:cytochrome c oxidase subunit III
MNNRNNTIEKAKMPLSMHPQKFALWLFIVSVVMIFAALTSAYIVRESDGNWLEFELPSLFSINTGIILLSSVTMHWAYLSAKKNNINNIKIGLLITLGLGLAFLIGQYYAWLQLDSMDVYFEGNPSGSFVYVLSGLHGFHIISAIVFVLVVLINTLQYKIHSRNMIRMEMLTTFWHFLDFLWVYLFLFLLLNK